MPDTYVYLQAPGHPNADRNGQIREHVLVVATAMGKPLPSGAQVHHVNGDGSDNRHENLVACENDAYHKLLHQRQRALTASGHANFLPCSECGFYDDPPRLRFSGRSPLHPHCISAFHHRHYEAYRRRLGRPARKRAR